MATPTSKLLSPISTSTTTHPVPIPIQQYRNRLISRMASAINDPTPALHPSAADLRSDTYAVDLPRDAAHSPPPPPPANNASASETPGQPPQRRAFFSRPGVVITLLIVFSVLSFTAIALGFSYLLLSPKHPTLSISKIMVKHPLVLISLKAQNPNNRVAVYYETGGTAALSFKNKTVATGPFPTFFLKKKGSRAVGLVLRAANKTMMPRQVRNTKTKLPLDLDLTMNVPVRVRIWTTKIWIEELVFDCKFKVNTLSNSSRILNQRCPIIMPAEPN